MAATPVCCWALPHDQQLGPALGLQDGEVGDVGEGRVEAWLGLTRDAVSSARAKGGIQRQVQVMRSLSLAALSVHAQKQFTPNLALILQSRQTTMF